MGGSCSKKQRKKSWERSEQDGRRDQRQIVSAYNSKRQAAADGERSDYKAQENKDDEQVKLNEQQQQRQQSGEEEPFSSYANAASAAAADEFYDGIPRYQSSASSLRSRSVRSKQAAVAKVSEVSSRIGRASSVGLGKAVEVLDTLGSSMTNLNPSSGFGSAGASKGNELGIVSFEVANTIVKGCNLLQSLSKRSIRQLKEGVLPSEGVQNLISEDIDELMKIVAADKREELKIFMAEVIRFGNRCKNSQWHNLDRYFEKISRERTSQRKVREEAESVVDLLMTLVEFTAREKVAPPPTTGRENFIDHWSTSLKPNLGVTEDYVEIYSVELYHELQVLDRMEHPVTNQKENARNNLGISRVHEKNRRKRVRNLKKKSLWCRTMEEVMEKLVDIAHFLLLEIHSTFGSTDSEEPPTVSFSNHQRLGPAGLSLHYANVVMQIDTLVARSSAMPSSLRDTLYQNLPPSIKSALRSKLRSFNVKEEVTITEIKDEMEKTLHWLVPISTNTAKAHHGFGWVGEWAGAGTEVNRKPAAVSGLVDIIQIETLHHASKEKTEAYILELLLWLHHLLCKSSTGPNGSVMKSPFKSRILTPGQKSNEQLTQESASAPLSSVEAQKMLQDDGK